MVHIPISYWLFIFILIIGCTSKRKVTSSGSPKTAQEYAIHIFDTTSVHSGLYMVEAEMDSGRMDPLIDYHSNSLFTPASNTKILTLYSSLKFLPLKLQGFQWLERNDTTFIRGTGDPGFLDPRFDSSLQIKFLRQKDNLVFVSDWSSDSRWGPGWSWDDYPYYFAAERSPFPLYGNVIRAWCLDGDWSFYPSAFIRNEVLSPTTVPIKRNEFSNIFHINPLDCRPDTVRKPFVWTPDLAAFLISDTIRMPVEWSEVVTENGSITWETFPGTDRDTLLRTMMYDSDNLIAEQLLMNTTFSLWNSFNAQKVIDTLMSEDFHNWLGRIRWVDGSGLSIYNKFTPRFLTEVLRELYNYMPPKQLFRYFAAGGTRGTITSWYGNKGEPFVYAKTGTLSGVHCLSGYLITDSGKTFIFSFMHNNYVGSSTPLKVKMDKLLRWVKENY